MACRVLGSGARRASSAQDRHRRARVSCGAPTPPDDPRAKRAVARHTSRRSFSWKPICSSIGLCSSNSVGRHDPPLSLRRYLLAGALRSPVTSPRSGSVARSSCPAHHDRELEALGPVDGEDAHGVVVGLGSTVSMRRVLGPGLLGRCRQCSRAARRPPRRRTRAPGLHHPQAPRVVAVDVGSGGELTMTPLAHDAFESPRWATARRVLVHVVSDAIAAGDRIVGREPRTDRADPRLSPSGRRARPGSGTGRRRRSRRAASASDDDHAIVARVVDRLEDGEQLAHLVGAVHQGVGSTRYGTPAASSARSSIAQRRAARDQDADVAGAGPGGLGRRPGRSHRPWALGARGARCRDSAASRTRNSPATTAVRARRSGGHADDTTSGPGDVARRVDGGRLAACALDGRPGSARRTPALTHRRTGGGPEVERGGLDRAGVRAVARGRTPRCRPAGTGRSTASGRRRRTAARVDGSASGQGRNVAGRAARAAGRARPAAGRCPGTRR